MHAAKDGMKSAQHTTAHALGAAAEELGSAKKSTLAAVTGVISSVLEGAAVAGTLFATLKKLDSDDGLAWLGLARRRSTLSTILLFGAGATVGAGVALFFAPITGLELRNALFHGTLGVAKEEDKSTKAPKDGAPVSGRSAMDAAWNTGGPSDGAPENGTSVRG